MANRQLHSKDYDFSSFYVKKIPYLSVISKKLLTDSLISMKYKEILTDSDRQPLSARGKKRLTGTAEIHLRSMIT